VETVPPPPGARHAKLKLQPSTIVRLMRWQYEAVEAGEPKPTYSDLIDALVVRSANLRATEVLLPLQETG
jgi:hypothetical protein